MGQTDLWTKIIAGAASTSCTIALELEARGQSWNVKIICAYIADALLCKDLRDEMFHAKRVAWIELLEPFVASELQRRS
jgi:hypothetical protein